MGVDTWDSAPVTTDGAGWKSDEGVAVDGGWQADTNGGNDGFTGEFSSENISKHANGDAGAPADGGCRICGDEAHFARDCPDKKPNTGECYRCGEMGHSKADCVNEPVEREFTGECRNCGEMGHRKAACPQLPPQVCKICGEEGHKQAECNANRMIINFTSLGIKDVSVEEAWKEVEAADHEKDVDDIKKAILTYAKAYPEVTFPELESVFRDAGMNTHLIAKKQQVSATHTIINLQGQIDQSYAVSIQFSAKPRRKKTEEEWPANAEENITRLAEAGIVMDRMVQQCANCNELGHGSKTCSQEKVEKEKKVITCANCGETDHYARDCKQPRKTGKKECKVCGGEDHLARDCPNEECRNCGELGHKAKDCEKERRLKCRNCDQWDHVAKDCDQPRDWSRVTCSNCNEKGHGRGRCPNPPAEPTDDGAGGGFETGGGGDGAGEGAGGWDASGGGGDGW